MQGEGMELITRGELNERNLYCKHCGTRRTAWDTAICQKCLRGAGWDTDFDLTFEWDDEHGSFLFMGTGPCELRKRHDRERSLTCEPEWEHFGLSEWYRELRILAYAYALIVRHGKITQLTALEAYQAEVEGFDELEYWTALFMDELEGFKEPDKWTVTFGSVIAPIPADELIEKGGEE